MTTTPLMVSLSWQSRGRVSLPDTDCGPPSRWIGYPAYRRDALSLLRAICSRELRDSHQRVL